MKTYQILLAGALMFGSVSTSMAQTDTKAIVEQTTQLIKAKGADFEKQVKDLQGKQEESCGSFGYWSNIL